MKFHYLIKSLIFLSIFPLFAIALNSTERPKAEDEYFYALSSLKFFIDQTISKISKDKKNDFQEINIDESEMTFLWGQVFQENLRSEELNEAKSYYDEALNQAFDDCKALQLYIRSKNILDNVWEKNNAYITKKEISFNRIRSKNKEYPNFDNNPFINKSMRKKMRRYLVPLGSHLWTALEKICNSPNVLQNEATLNHAGFKLFQHRNKSFVRVVSHPELPGYLCKLYLESDCDQVNEKPCWERLTDRCEGAENIRNLIKDKKLIRFVVPKKWLYPLPFYDLSSKNEDDSVQVVLLVVTDMKLASREECIAAWKYKITTKHLDELYCILSHGFSSTHLHGNIPYCEDGTFACIDTEYPKRKLNYGKVNRYLSHEMRKYWNELVKKGGKGHWRK